MDKCNDDDDDNEERNDDGHIYTFAECLSPVIT